MTSTFSAGIGDSESSNAAKMRVVRGRRLSFSLYAGTMMECVIGASEAALVGVFADRVRLDIFVGENRVWAWWWSRIALMKFGGRKFWSTCRTRLQVATKLKDLLPAGI